VILWDVDTQGDFMLPEGKLYVPGAEQAAPAMERLVAAARAAGIRTTYPPHCLRGTRGARKIRETEQEDPVPLGLQQVPEEYIRGREFLLLKKHFDVFTNPHAERLLELLDPDEIVVFGVATDVCDDAAIRGFLERGRRVRFVEDAARGLDEGRVEACTTAWRERGVEFATVDEVLRLV